MMSSNFEILLTLLLCNRCFNAAAHLTTPATPTENENNKTNIEFLDLNFDVLHLIVNAMELPELRNIAQTNSKFRLMAIAAFRVKYQDYEVSMPRHNYEVGVHSQDLYYEYNDNGLELHIFDEDFGIAVLQQFGSAINKLDVYKFDRDQKTIDLPKMINTYCADTLILLDISYIQERTLEQFTRPFKKLEVFDFNIVAIDITGTVMPFSELFPNLSKLNMSLRGESNNYGFIDHIPNLKQLDLYHSGSTSKHCEAILSRNPQIIRLIVDTFPGYFLNNIDQLPDLQDLSVNRLRIKNKQFHFKNVKHLKLTNFHSSSLKLLSFAQLESIEEIYIEYYQVDFNELREFLRKHQSVTKLCLDTNSELVNLDMRLMDALKAELPNLQDFKLITD